VSEKNFLIDEYLAKLQPRVWLSRALCVPNQHTANKNLSYRRGTARRAVSVETVQNVTQMFVELHLRSSATGE